MGIYFNRQTDITQISKLMLNFDIVNISLEISFLCHKTNIHHNS